MPRINSLIAVVVGRKWPTKEAMRRCGLVGGGRGLRSLLFKLPSVVTVSHLPVAYLRHKNSQLQHQVCLHAAMLPSLVRVD